MSLRTEDELFTEFARGAAPRLNVALTAAYGPEVGHDAASEALAYGWQHWDRLRGMDNPAGYLYRVGQSRARRLRKWWRRVPCPPVPEWASNPEPWIEPGLPGALRSLTRRQRVAVVLVCGYGWTQTEVAELLGISRTAVEQHMERGLRSLRRDLKVAA
jgi:RNA polymerase sigma-70 factor (ECF subfamily)